MSDYIKAARGSKRLHDMAALPCIDLHSEIRYFGSISKCGDNADWDWGMYEDENGEWVLAEAEKSAVSIISRRSLKAVTSIRQGLPEAESVSSNKTTG